MATLTISAADEKRVKALGFLSNKGTDNFSGRIITVNGKITAAQQRCIAEAAEKFGNGIVTFTTRLTIEVQGIPYDCPTSSKSPWAAAPITASSLT